MKAVTAREHAERVRRFQHQRLSWLVEKLANADPGTVEPGLLRAKLGWFCTAPAPQPEQWEQLGPPAFMAFTSEGELSALHREVREVFVTLFPDPHEVPIRNAGPGMPRAAQWPRGLGFAGPIPIQTGLYLSRTPYSQANGVRHRITLAHVGRDLRACFWPIVAECLTAHGPFVQRCAICRRFFVSKTSAETQCSDACHGQKTSQYGKAYYERKGGKATVAARAEARAAKKAKRRTRRT